MKEFSFLDYWTEYSCEGSISKDMKREWCFSKVFNEVQDKSNVKYQVVLYKGTDYSKEKHASNACLFTKKEIRKHLKILKSIYPLTYSVTDYDKRDNYERIVVELSIKEVPATFHKYALTWLRYTYEYPYNVLLKDAYSLKKDPVFRFESIANLFNLAIGCFCDNPSDIHQIPTNCVSKRMKVSEVRERIREVNRLNSIYARLKAKVKQVPTKINGFSVTDVEYWNEGFDQRKPIYMDVYKDIRK